MYPESISKSFFHVTNLLYHTYVLPFKWNKQSNSLILGNYIHQTIFLLTILHFVATLIFESFVILRDTLDFSKKLLCYFWLFGYLNGIMTGVNVFNNRHTFQSFYRKTSYLKFKGIENNCYWKLTKHLIALFLLVAILSAFTCVAFKFVKPESEQFFVHYLVHLYFSSHNILSLFGAGLADILSVCTLIGITFWQLVFSVLYMALMSIYISRIG